MAPKKTLEKPKKKRNIETGKQETHGVGNCHSGVIHRSGTGRTVVAGLLAVYRFASLC